jgi:hypothetical protein
VERRDWMDWESFVVRRSNVYVGLVLDEVRFDVSFVEVIKAREVNASLPLKIASHSRGPKKVYLCC